MLYGQPTASAGGTYFNLTADNVIVTNSGSGTDDYCLNLQLSGYQYIILSPYIAATYTGPPINVSVPLGLFN